MLGQKVKGMCNIIIIFVIILTFGNGKGIAEASKSTVMRQGTVAGFNIELRKINLYGKVFELHINHTDELITIYGEAEDWDQEDKVKNYFNLRTPKNYTLVYKIDLEYN